MKISNCSGGVIAAGMGAVFVAQSACAQDGVGEVVFLDPIVVSAPLEDDSWAVRGPASFEKTGTPLRDFAQSVDIIPGSVIKDLDAQSVQDVLRTVPAVVPSPDGGMLFAAPLIRGVGARTYFDGQPAFTFTNSADPLTAIQVERVEVIKGPSGTFSGGGVGAPLGGIINVVRKRPVIGDAFIEAKIDGGNHDAFGISGDINAPLTKSDQIAVRMQAGFRQDGSFIDDVEGTRVNVFPSLEWRPSAKTEITVLAHAGRNEFVNYAGFPAAVLGFSGFDRDQFPGALNPPASVVETRSVQLFADTEISENWTLHGTLQHLINDFEERDSFLSSSLDFPDLQDTTFPVVTGVMTSDVEEVTGSVWAKSGLWTGSLRHNLVFGVEADLTQYSATMFFGPTGDVIDVLNPVRPAYVVPDSGSLSKTRRRLGSVDLYVQDQIDLTERLHLTTALRWSNLETASFLETGRETELASKLVPRAGVSFDASDALTLFAGYGEGFNQVLFFTPEDPAAKPVPETSRQYEIGAKFDFPSGLSGSFAAYELYRENVPVSAPTATNPAAQVQTGEVRSRGAEISLVWEPDDALSLMLQYAYVNAEITQGDAARVGSTPDRVPVYSGRIAARYRFLDGAFEGLSVGAGVTFASGSEVTVPNTFRTDSYAVFDARAAYDFGGARLALSVENLFDDSYFVPNGFLNSHVAPGAPRTFRASLSATF